MRDLYIPSQRPNLVQDIVPKTKSGWNTKDPAVRNQRISYLDSEYMASRTRKSKKISLSGTSEEYRIKTRRVVSYLNNLKAKTANSIKIILTSVKKAVKLGALAVATTFGRAYDWAVQKGEIFYIKLRQMPLLPQKYKLKKGVYVNWHTRTFKNARLAVPALALVWVVLAATVLQTVTSRVYTLPKGGTYEVVNTPKPAPVVDPKSDSPDKPSSSWSKAVSRPSANAAKPVPSPVSQSIITPETPVLPVGGSGGGSTDPVVIPEEPAPDILEPVNPIVETIQDVLTP